MSVVCSLVVDLGKWWGVCLKSMILVELLGLCRMDCGFLSIVM